MSENFGLKIGFEGKKGVQEIPRRDKQLFQGLRFRNEACRFSVRQE